MLSSTLQAALIALLVFLIVLVVLTWYKQGMPPFLKDKGTVAQTKAASQGQENAKGGQSSAVSSLPIERDHDSSEEQYGSNGRLRKTENTDEALATYTFWLTVSTAVLAFSTVCLVVATIGLWWYAAEQAGDMKRSLGIADDSAKAAAKSADVAEKTLIASNRPWIAVDVGVGSDLVFDERGWTVTFSYRLQNVGNAVAVNTDVVPKFIAYDFGSVQPGPPPNIIRPSTDAASELLNLCRTSANMSEMAAKADWLNGDPIFPNGQIRSGFTVSIPEGQVRLARSASAYKNVNPLLVVCVTYRYWSDKKTHFTGYVFNLSRIDSNSPGGAREINPDEGSVPQNELRLTPQPFRSGFAT